MIKHEEKHKILKQLAEAGYELLLSGASDKEKLRNYLEIHDLIQRLEDLEEEGECNCEAYETEEVIPLEEAVNALSDGHGCWSPQFAFKVCKALEVPFPKNLLQHQYSDWADYKGLHMDEGKEGSVGVWSLQISSYIAKELGVKERAGSYLGRGFQAQAYAREVRKLMVEQGKLPERKETE